MTDNLHTHLKRAGEQISLTEAERARMRDTVRMYMEMKPLRIPATPSAARWSFNWLLSPRPVAAVLAVAVFASCAGVSYAAEDALPGDTLYPVKTHINEPVAGAFAVSAQAKAAWAAGVANERLQEATVLAAQGRLASSTAQELQANFDAHAQVAATNMQEEASTSPEMSAQTALRFNAQLAAYGQMLAQIGAVQNASTSVLQDSIHAAQERVATVQAFSEQHLGDATAEKAHVAIAASVTRDAANIQLAESLRTAHEFSGALASSSAAQVAHELEGAGTTISSGDDFLDSDAVPQALGAFQSALGTSARIGAFLQASDAIHKHTGLIIDDSEQATSTPSKRTQSGGNSRKQDEQESRQSASTTPIQENEDAHAPFQSGQSATATSSTSVHPHTGDDSEIKLHDDVQTDDSIEIPHVSRQTLPISVPAGLLQD